MLAHLASLVEQDAWEHTWEDEDDDEPQQPIPAPIFQALHLPLSSFILAQATPQRTTCQQNHNTNRSDLWRYTQMCDF
jgi:hypothetical protein